MRLFKKQPEQASANDGAAPAPQPLREGALLARWYVMHRLNEEIQRARRYERPLSIVLAQPDLIAGEKLPQDTVEIAANVALSTARATDLVGWLSDNSIIVILPETTGDRARYAASRLRDEMWLQSRSRGGRKWKVTALDQLEEVAAAFSAMPPESRAA